MPRKKDEQKPAEKVTTIRLPEPWHEELRAKAFHERTTITDLIKEALKEKYGYKVQSLAGG